MAKVTLISQVNITVFGKNAPKGEDISKDKDGKLVSVNPKWNKKGNRIDFKKDKKIEVEDVVLEWNMVKSMIENGTMFEVAAKKKKPGRKAKEVEETELPPVE